jgi:Cro/C1-type helix-turn-helix DNA-binding protein
MQRDPDLAVERLWRWSRTTAWRRVKEVMAAAGIFGAPKRVIARQLDALMQDQGLTKSDLAKLMQTSRAQLDRVLDPENESVTLSHADASSAGRRPSTAHGACVATIVVTGQDQSAPDIACVLGLEGAFTAPCLPFLVRCASANVRAAARIKVTNSASNSN